MTAKEWVSAFDNGSVIESISMGGMGLGYEQAIQSCTVETVRQLLTTDEENLKWASEKAVKILDGRHGFSGAQVAAARNLAMNIWRRGTESFQDIPDRIIKIQKDATDPALAKVIEGDIGE